MAVTLTKNFDLGEFQCHDGCPVPPELVGNVKRLAEQLEVLRRHLGGKPIKVRSGYRTPARNAAVKGAKESQHLVAKAADIVVHGAEANEVHAAIESLILRGRMEQGGLGLYLLRPGRSLAWVHYDVRGARARWAG